MNRPDRVSGPAVPDEIDQLTPSIARVYNASLGGKDNFAVDREVLRQLLEVEPSCLQISRDNRDWLIRVTRFLAGEVGIDQFFDLGAGLPAAENTHEAAQRLNSDAEVVYLDKDPVVIAHARALLEDNDATHIKFADFTKVDEVLGDPEVNRWLELDRPLGLYLIATLHHVPDEQDPAGVVRKYVDALPSGSYVAITHFVNPSTGEAGEIAERMHRVFVDGPLGTGFFRTRDEIAGYFDGLELIEPGLTLLPDWWPDGPRVKPLTPVQHCLIGGVGRKP